MKHHFLFKLANSYSPLSFRGGMRHSTRCEECKKFRIHWSYDDLIFDVEGIKKWPLVMGGIYHTAFHEEVVAAFSQEGISGAEFHPLKALKVKDADILPEPPKYYILEPAGVVNIRVPWDEFVQCGTCGEIEKFSFGAFKKPFEMDWNSWDGSDVVGLRNVYPNWICVNRKVVDLFRKNQWYRQIARGTGNRPYESLQFGGNPVPGVGVRNIDSDHWYEDTMDLMKQTYPDWNPELD